MAAICANLRHDGWLGRLRPLAWSGRTSIDRDNRIDYGGEAADSAPIIEKAPNLQAAEWHST